MHVKVAIVGAGASGLMCAHKLLNNGSIKLEPSDLLVVEARNRLGGRIHTTLDSLPIISNINDDDDTGIGNTTAASINIYRDHGAAWVHGTGFRWPAFSSIPACNDRPINPMMELLQQITATGESVCGTHLEPIFVHGNPWTRPGRVLHRTQNLALFVEGQCCKHDDEIITKALEFHNQIMIKVGTMGYNMSVKGDMKASTEMSFQQALDIILSLQNEKNPKVSLVAGFYRHLIECWHGTSASGLQLLEFSANIPDETDDNNDANDIDDDSYDDEGDFFGPHCTLKQGMLSVLKPLIQSSSSCVCLNDPVVSIRKQSVSAEKTICVETGSGMVVEADFCVVTVSLGCLANSVNSISGINFVPELSAEKQDAIQRMQMGCYKKVFLTFDRIFWPKEEYFIGLVRSCKDENNDIGCYLLLGNLWASKGVPSIEAVLVGDAGLWATNKTDKVIRDAVLGFLSDAMGYNLSTELQPWCVNCHISRWEEDPYSLGAYSGYRLGTLAEHTEALKSSDWENRLHFAGEATISGYEGSVHAALISGDEVANTIAAHLATL